MAKYFLSNKAVDDLSNIWNYTYKMWSEYQANKYYRQLIASCEKISNNSKTGKNYDEIDKNIYGYRIGHHIIFYQVAEDNEIVVLRFLHVNMDLKNRIQEL